MGVVYVQNKPFIIAGNEPTAAEQARINQALTPPAPVEGLGSLFAKGFGRGIDAGQAGLYSMGEMLADRNDGSFLGRTAEEYRALADEQRAERDSVQGVEGGFLDQDTNYGRLQVLAQSLGETIPSTLFGMGATAAGAVGGATVGGPVGAAVGGGLGMLAAAAGYAPQQFNENVEAQIAEHGDVKDWGKVTTATILQAGAESIADKLTLGAAGIIGKTLKKSVIDEASKGAMRTIAGKIGSGAAMGAVTEVPTEVIQSALTRWQAEQGLMSEDAQRDYLESAIVAGILGGTIGGVAGVGGGISQVRNDMADTKIREIGAKQAKQDADIESQRLTEMAERSVSRETPEQNLPFVEQIKVEDSTASPDNLSDKGSKTSESNQVFSEDEYRQAVDALRNEKSVSKDKIRRNLKFKPQKASAIFDEIKRRGDAVPVGHEGQYLKIKSAVGNQTKEGSDYTAAKPVYREYGVEQTKDGFTVTETTTENGVQSSRIVQTHPTAKEANEAKRQLDPNYSVATNKTPVTPTIADEMGEYSVNLQKMADTIVGEGRVAVDVAPTINADYLAPKGIAAPPPNSVVEGVTIPPAERGLRQFIAVANDLYDPALPKAERQAKLNSVLGHELFHAVRNADLLTPKEWGTLVDYAGTNKVPGKLYTWAQKQQARRNAKSTPEIEQEEMLAEMFRAYMDDPTQFTGAPKNLLQKLADFLKRILKLARTRSADEILDAMKSGEIGKRDTGSGGMGERTYPGKAFFSSVKVPAYYMKSDKFFMDAKQDKAPASQWLGMLKNAGIKQEELDWLGLVDELKKQEGTVSKGDILDYIRANGVDIQERWAFDNPPDSAYEEFQKATKADEERINVLYEALKEELGPASPTAFNSWLHDQADAGRADANELLTLSDNLDEKRREFFPNRYHGFNTQQSGKDYTEVVFYIPTLSPEFSVDIHYGGFKNIIASARLKTRDYGNGKKTLFIEEIQSDLHQKGQKKGYATKEVMNDYNVIPAELAELDQKIRSRVAKIESLNHQRLMTGNAEKIAEIKEQENQLREVHSQDVARRNALKARMQEIEEATTIPDAPLKSTWEEFTFRRLLRYAAENGFDEIAWHGDPKSVADTEKWENRDVSLRTRVDAEGNPIYEIGPRDEADIFIEPQSVTGVINTYLRKLRNIATKVGKPFQSVPMIVKGKASIPTEEDWNQIFMQPMDMRMAISEVLRDGSLPNDIVSKLKKMSQIARNQRTFDPVLAIEQSGIDPTEFMSLLEDTFPETGSQNSTYDEQGNPRHDRFVLEINDRMREEIPQTSIPLWSAVERAQASPEFRNWFGNSAVVDESGKPMVVYHATDVESDFDIFRPMSHFGTEEAAGDRLNAKLPLTSSGTMIGERLGIPYNQVTKWWAGLEQEERDRLHEEQFEINREAWKDARIYPVFLSIKNPLRIIDNGYDHTTEEYAVAARDAGAISEQYLDSFIARKAPLANLVSVLKAKGYDGFVYTNNAEDTGSDSWVAFDESQIKSVFNRGTWSNSDPRISFSAVQVETPAFKSWFKDSKIVDYAGKPLVVFHGSVADFDEFDPRAGKTDHGWYGHGFYFSPFPEEASQYAKRQKKETNDLGFTYPVDDWTGGNVMPVYLSLQNPYRWPANKPSFVYPEDAAKFTEELKKAGFDGVIVEKWGSPDEMWEIVAFSPDQIKSAIGNRGTFDPNDKRIQFSAVEAQYSATAPMGQRVPNTAPLDTLSKVELGMRYNNVAPILQKLAGVLPTSIRVPMTDTYITPRKSTQELIDGTFIALQDRMLPVGKLIDRIRDNGGFISNESDTYLREQLFSGQVDERLQANQRTFYNPLVTVVNNLPVSKEDMDDAAKINDAARSITTQYSNKPKIALAELYLYAQHAQERNAEMRRRNENLQHERPEEYDAGSGMSDIEAQEILAWFDAHKHGRKFWDLTDANSVRSQFRRLISNTNDIRVAGGLNPDFRVMTTEDGEPIDPYEDYAPLRGFINEHVEDEDADIRNIAKTGKGYRVAGKEDLSAVGRSSLGADLIANAILQNEEAIIRAGKNEVANSFVRLIEDNRDAMKDTAEILYSRPMKYTYDRRAKKVRRVVDQRATLGPDILVAKQDGNEILVRIKDARVAKAMNQRSSLGNAGAGAIMKGLLAFNRFLAATRTSYNPEFMISNFLRDLEAAMVNISEHDMKEMKGQIIRSLPNSFKGIWEGVRHGTADTEWGKIYRDFREHGGAVAFQGIRDLANTIQRINSEFAQDLSGPPGKALKAIKEVGNLVEGMNATVENGIRVATYKALRDRFIQEGSDTRRASERAAFMAKNLTVNFNMGGDAKPFMNAMYLFFNASIQGSMALINPLARSKKMRKIWASVLAMGLAQDIINSFLSDEDDDGIKQYDKIPDYILTSNIVFMDPFGISERGYFKIPMPYLMNGVYNTGRVINAGLRGRYTPGEAANSIVGVMADGLNPWGASNTWANFVAPTVLDPIVDLGMNANYQGAPIAPPETPFGVSERASQRYWNNTNPIYTSIASWLANLPGIGGEGQYIPGAIEWSPNQIEYVMEWLGGGAWTFAARTGGLLLSDKERQGTLLEMMEGGDWSANDIPFLRRFYGNVSQREDLQYYLKNRDEVLRVRAELRAAAKDGDSEGYRALMERHPRAYRIASQINALENLRRKLSKQINKIRENKNIPDERKKALIKQLKERQADIVGRANARFRVEL